MCLSPLFTRVRKKRIAGMALLTWAELSWEEFVVGLEGYRDNYSGKSRGDEAYVGCLGLMQSRPLRTRAEGRELVGFLNRWACRLSSVKTPNLIAGWAHDHMSRLEQFEPLTILDEELPDHADELGSLHDGLIAHVKSGGVLNMSDAAASKTLHMLIPELFVMWDKEIKRSAPGGYGAYQLQMHELARRLAAEAVIPIDEVGVQLQERLGYRVCKPLAKYLDEYNWFEAVGRDQLARR
jgi:hypothetical protein